MASLRRRDVAAALKGQGEEADESVLRNRHSSGDPIGTVEGSATTGRRRHCEVSNGPWLAHAGFVTSHEPDSRSPRPHP